MLDTKNCDKPRELCVIVGLLYSSRSSTLNGEAEKPLQTRARETGEVTRNEIHDPIKRTPRWRSVWY